MSYLLYGQNGLLLDERVNSLRADLDPPGLSTTIIDVQSSRIGEIAAACQAIPFFGGRRLVILRDPIHAPKRGDGASSEDAEGSGGRVNWADLQGLLKATPPTTEVIIRHDGSLAQTHYLVKAVKALGWKVESFAPRTGHDLRAWVQQRVERQDVRIGSAAVERLLNLLYPWEGDRWANETPDMRLIATEIDKLCCAVDDGSITTAIVEELVADRSGFRAFQLNNALFEGHVERALIELERVLSAGEAEERVFAQVGSEVIALMTVQRSAGLPTDAVATASGLNASRVAGLQTKAAGISEPAMTAISESVRRADASVKTGLQTDTSATIVPLVAEVAEVVRRGGVGRRR